MNCTGDSAERRTGPALEAICQYVRWLIPTVDRIPRGQKFLLGDRIRTTAFAGLERLVEATFTRTRGRLARCAPGRGLGESGSSPSIVGRIPRPVPERRRDHGGRAVVEAPAWRGMAARMKIVPGTFIRRLRARPWRPARAAAAGLLLLGLSAPPGPPSSALAQGAAGLSAEQAAARLANTLRKNLKRDSTVVVRPLTGGHTGLPDLVAKRIETLIVGTLGTTISTSLDVSLITGDDVHRVYGSLEASSFGSDAEKLLASVLQAARADTVLACEPTGATPDTFELRCSVTYGKVACADGGTDPRTCEGAIEVKEVRSLGAAQVKFPWGNPREYLNHAFTGLAWEIVRDAGLNHADEVEIKREGSSSATGTDLGEFVTRSLRREIAAAKQRSLGWRGVAGEERFFRLLWHIVPWGKDSYELSAELHEEAPGGTRYVTGGNASIVISSLPANMRLGGGDGEDDTDTVPVAGGAGAGAGAAGSNASVSPFGGRAILDVKTEPAGARVLVGGELAGETPLLRSDLRAGTWTMVLDHPLHETVRLEGQALASRRVLKVRHRLDRARGELTVLVVPSVAGAWVEHGGRRHEVPVTLEGMLSGPAELRLGGPGHREARLAVEVPKGDVAVVEHRLEPVRYGTLTVTTVPADALVELAGAESYRAGMRLPEGAHRLRVSRGGYRAAERELEVSGDTSLRVELERAKYSFTVVAIPSDAEVRLLDTAERYRPGLELPPGRYRVRVSAEGWRAREETVVHGQSSTRREFRLERVPPSPEEVEGSLGLTSAQRRLVQQGLGSLGIEVGVVDGLFGPGTRASVRTYQRRKQYAATGYLTEAQARALMELGEERRSDDARFAEARRLHTAESYRAYLERGGRHETEARGLLAELSKPRWEPGQKFRDCEGCPELVVVPPGSYEMGSPSGEAGRDSDEGPLHRVTLSELFGVGVYEVTFLEWDACRRDGGCSHNPADKGWGRGNRPVIGVSWDDAKEYVRWLSRETGASYRLLSESEWEYVARAGTRGPFHYGETISTSQANYDGNYRYGSGRTGRYRERTVPVGTFSSNGFGLHDVHGNVWEWVEDCWHGGYGGAPLDGSAWTSGGDCVRRVLRGGSWSNGPGGLRSANRYRSGTGNRNDDVGFRIARTLD